MCTHHNFKFLVSSNADDTFVLIFQEIAQLLSK